MQDDTFPGNAPLPEVPAPVVKQRAGLRAVLFTVAGLLLVGLLVVGGLLVVKARNTPKLPPTLAQIMQHATAAKPQDASFTLTNTSDSTIDSMSISTKNTGTGDIIGDPFQLHVTLAGGSDTATPSFTSNETIVQGDSIFIKVPQIPQNLGIKNPFGTKPWMKLPYDASSPDFGSDALSGFTIKNFLDYGQLTDVKLIGSEKIAGKATWHVHGTLGNPAPTSTSLASTSDSNSEDLWILQSSYLPAQIAIHGATSLSTSATGGTGALSLATTTEEIVTFSRWNSGVLVSAPAPDQVSDGLSGLLPPSPTPTPHH